MTVEHSGEDHAQVEVAARLVADRAYIDALRRGEDLLDARLGPATTYGRYWLPVHLSNLEQARGR